MLKDVVLLDRATNDRVQGEQQGLIGISIYELVYGIPNAHIVNAAFTHTDEAGGRFNDHTRGAWYATEELETSLAEVAYHKTRRLAEIVVPGFPGERPDEEISNFDDWMADFQSHFHVLDSVSEFSACLQPEPVPDCYWASQQTARQLLHSQSNGLIYTSVRRLRSRCIVCFRPALVYNPRLGKRLKISFTATDTGYEYQVQD
jgi:RES domain-containing protein